MGELKESKRKQTKQQSDNYKLVVYRSEDFHEVRSFNLSLGSIYIASSMVILLLVLAISSVIIFSPIKKFIPGYGDIEVNGQFLSLVDGVSDIENELEAQSVYIDAFRNLLTTGITKSQSGEAQLSSEYDRSLRSTVQSGNASGTVSNAMNQVNWSEIQGDPNELRMSLNNQKVLYPVDGLVSAEFDPSLRHYGIDILAAAKSPILAMTDGYVFSSGWDLETGYTIGIQHDDNILSFYKHNSRLLKEKGTFVRAGEAVAIIGNTGTMSNGPHLHFEIWHNGRPVNPTDFLNFN